MSLHRSFFPTQNILQLSTYSNLLLHKTNQVLWLPAWKSHRILSENHSEADDVFDCFYLQTGYCRYIRNWLIFVYFSLHIFYLAERRIYALARFPVIIHKKISESKRRALLPGVQHSPCRGCGDNQEAQDVLSSSHLQVSDTGQWGPPVKDKV